MKTNLWSYGTAHSNRSGNSPDATKKTNGDEARGEGEPNPQDKMQQVSQRADVPPSLTPTMLPRAADRNSGMSSLTAQTAADIVKDTQDRLENLGVSDHVLCFFLAR